MTTLRLVGGLPLLVGGELAVNPNCCCGGTCCACWLTNGTGCRLTDDSLQKLSEALGALGNRNVTVTNQSTAAAWGYQCCQVAEAGCVTITVDCVEEGTETLTFCPCTSSSAACADGVKEEDCDYDWTPGVNCETGPCPDCTGACGPGAPCPPGCRCLDGHCVGRCQGTCDPSTPCAYGCHCVSGQCQPCPCPTTLPTGWENGTGGCSDGAYVCIEYQFTGPDCDDNGVTTGVSGYAAEPILFYWPCVASQPSLGILSGVNLCGPTSDQYQIVGKFSCDRVVYESDCDCAPRDCDWTDIVAEWRGNPGATQCDCIMELVSYSIKASGDTCP